MCCDVCLVIYMLLRNRSKISIFVYLISLMKKYTTSYDGYAFHKLSLFFYRVVTINLPVIKTFRQNETTLL